MLTKCYHFYLNRLDYNQKDSKVLKRLSLKPIPQQILKVIPVAVEEMNFNEKVSIK